MPIVQIPVMRVRLANKKVALQALNMIGLDAEKTIRASFKSATKKIQARMIIPGKPVTYPIKWDSEKQRRAFFATNGFGGGIPHVRRGAYVAQWKQRTIRNGYEVRNDWDKAGYVAGNIRGEHQSRIHKGRWPLFKKVVDRVLALVPKEVISDLKVTFKKIGFRVK